MAERLLPEIEQSVGLESEARDKLSADELLLLSPRKLKEYFFKLERAGGLEAYLEEITQNSRVLAQISFWEKWFPEKQRKLIDKYAAENREIYAGGEDSLPLNLERRFSPETIKFLVEHMRAVQLTFGCSKGCPLCGVDAVPGVRQHISFDQIENLLRKYGKYIHRREMSTGAHGPFMYFASEPSDYRDGERTYKDVNDVYLRYVGYPPHATTSKTDSAWLRYLEKESRYPRVSLYEDKRARASNGSVPDDIEINQTGKGNKHAVGIGVSYRPEHDLVAGIINSQGVFMTPRGVYAHFPVPISEQWPNGSMIVPIENGLSLYPPKVGENIYDVLKRGLIPEYLTRAPLDVFSTNLMRLESKDGAAYRVAIDKDYKVSLVLTEAEYGQSSFKVAYDIATSKELSEEQKIDELTRIVSKRQQYSEANSFARGSIKNLASEVFTSGELKIKFDNNMMGSLLLRDRFQIVHFMPNRFEEDARLLREYLRENPGGSLRVLKVVEFDIVDSIDEIVDQILKYPKISTNFGRGRSILEYPQKCWVLYEFDGDELEKMKVKKQK